MNESQSLLVARLVWVTRFAGVFSAMMGGTVLTGWISGIFEFDPQIDDRPGPMSLPSSIGFLLLGFTLALTPIERDAPYAGMTRAATRLTALVLACVAIATLTVDVLESTAWGTPFPANAEADTWRLMVLMPPISALAFLVAGTAAMLVPTRQQWRIIMAQSMAVLVVLIGGTGLLGVAFATADIDAQRPFGGISALSATGFVVVGIGLLAARPDRGLMAVVLANPATVVVWRRLALAGFFVLFGIGWLHLLDEHSTTHRMAVEVAVMMVVAMALLVAIVTWAASSIVVAENHRLQFQREISQQREYFHTMLKSIADAVIAIDGHRHVTFINPVAEQLTGWSATDAQGKPIEQIIGLHDEHTKAPLQMPKPDPQADAAVDPVVDPGVRPQLAHRDGRLIPIDIRAAAIFSDLPLGTTAAGTVYVFRDVTQMRTIERTLERRVARRTAEIRRLAMQLSQSERNERQRIARTLHDHLQQLLVAAKMRIGQIEKASTDAARRTALCKQADDLLRDSIDAARSLSVQLSPPILRESGLPAALAWLAAQMESEHHLSVVCECIPAEPPTWQSVHPEIADFVFQAVRELLLNVVKHAETDRATVEVVAAPDGTLAIGVIDAGKGSETAPCATPTSDATGFGLASIRQRVEFLGGQFAMETAPDRGCRVHFTVPDTDAGSNDHLALPA